MGLLDALSVMAQGAGGYAQGMDRREREKQAKEERDRVLQMQKDRDEAAKTNRMLMAGLQRQQMDLQKIRNEQTEVRLNAQMALQQQDREATVKALEKKDRLDRDFRKAQLRAGVLTDLMQAQDRGKMAVLGNLQSVIAYKAMTEQNPSFRDPLIESALKVGGGVMDFGDQKLVKELGSTIGVDFTTPEQEKTEGRQLGQFFQQVGVTPEEELAATQMPSRVTGVSGPAIVPSPSVSTGGYAGGGSILDMIRGARGKWSEAEKRRLARIQSGEELELPDIFSGLRPGAMAGPRR